MIFDSMFDHFSTVCLTLNLIVQKLKNHLISYKYRNITSSFVYLHMFLITIVPEYIQDQTSRINGCVFTLHNITRCRKIQTITLE